MDKIYQLRKNLRIAIMNHFGQSTPIQIIANKIGLSRSETSRILNERVDLSLRKIFEIESILDQQIINIVDQPLMTLDKEFASQSQVFSQISDKNPWLMKLLERYSSQFELLEKQGLRPIYRDRPAYLSLNLVPLNSTTGGFHLAFLKPIKKSQSLKIQFIVKNDDFIDEFKKYKALFKGNTNTKYTFKDDGKLGHAYLLIEDFSNMGTIDDVLNLLARVYEIQSK